MQYLFICKKKYLKVIGREDANFKAFRSTFGKLLLDAGINIKYVSQLLGHSSVETTEKHYAKFITQERKG